MDLRLVIYNVIIIILSLAGHNIFTRKVSEHHNYLDENGKELTVCPGSCNKNYNLDYGENLEDYINILIDYRK
jgi:hypothetical protein